MARPLKYGEKTSVRSITIPDTMWEDIPAPKSAWVVEAVRQMQEVAKPLSSVQIKELTEQVKALPDLVIDEKCTHTNTTEVTKGTKCLDCGAFV